MTPTATLTATTTTARHTSQATKQYEPRLSPAAAALLTELDRENRMSPPFTDNSITDPTADTRDWADR